MREWTIWLHMYQPMYALDGVTVIGGTGPMLREEVANVQAHGAVAACWAVYDLWKGQPLHVEIDRMQRGSV